MVNASRDVSGPHFAESCCKDSQVLGFVLRDPHLRELPGNG